VVWDGGRYVAVGTRRGNGVAYASSDGSTWAEVGELEVQNRITGLAFGRERYVAITDRGRVLTSPDAVWWDVVVDDDELSLGAVVFDGARFTAVGGYSALSSEDGLVWARGSLEKGAGVLASTGSRLLAAGADGVVESMDGLTWRTIVEDRLPIAPVRATASNGETVVLAGDTGTYSSTDGVSWSRTAANSWNLSWTGDRFSMHLGDELVTSTDGWTWQSAAIQSECVPGALASNGMTHVAVGHTSICASTDWSTWVEVFKARDASLDDVAWNGSRFVAVGRQFVYSSPDGQQWSASASSPLWDLRAVSAIDGRFVVAGVSGGGSTRKGIALTSGDGVHWHDDDVGRDLELDGIAGHGDGFAAVGDDGVVWSADGAQWVGTTPGSGAYLQAASWHRGSLLAAGHGILRWGCDEAASPGAPGGFVRVLPAAAHLAGAAGTTWRSDAVLHNQGATTASASVFLLERDLDNRAATGAALAVPAGSSVAVDSILPTLFGRTETAGAVLVGSDLPLVVTSRTYNDSSVGTYGQAIPGLEVSALNELDSSLIQLRRSADYRTNIGVVNLGLDPVEVAVDLYDSQGTWLGARSHEVEPYSAVQDNDVFAKVGADEVADGYAVVSPASDEAVLVAYASVIDNRSGDPMLVLPPVTADGSLWVPASAHVSGANDTRWRTDLQVANLGQRRAEYTIEFLTDIGPTPVPPRFSLEPGMSVRYDDVVGTVLAASGAGALRVTCHTTAIQVSSRTYNDLEDHSYGQFIPAYTTAQGRARALLVGLTRSTAPDSGFRTNLGLVNTTEEAITVEVRLFSGEGAELGAVQLEAVGLGFVQVFDVFALVTDDEVPVGFAELHSSDPGASFIAYGSVVDNRSGDPVFIAPR